MTKFSETQIARLTKEFLANGVKYMADTFPHHTREEVEDFNIFLTSLVDVVKNFSSKKAKKEKVEKDPNRVKRPVPASWMFRDQNRSEIVAEHFEGKSPKGSEVSKKAKDLWDSMSTEEREPYETARAKLWEEYKASTPIASSASPKSPFVVMTYEGIELPSDWSGPHLGFLKGLAAGGKRSEGKFESFSDALEAANQLKSCGGITYNSKTGYSLRVGCEVKSDATSEKKAEMSWTKTDFEVVEPQKKARKKKAEKPVELEVELEELNKVIVPVPEQYKEESDEEESDEESDNEEGVVPWAYNGKNYYLNEDTGEVYNEDAAEAEDPKPIGERIDGELVLNKPKVKITKKKIQQ
jgi:hypothetical protein